MKNTTQATALNARVTDNSTNNAQGGVSMKQETQSIENGEVILGWKSKLKVLERLSGLTQQELQILDQAVEGEVIDLGKKYRYTSSNYYCSTYIAVEKLSGAVLERFLDIKEQGNDAPRGGRDGNYIIFKNTKKNKEIVKLIKELMKLINVDDKKK